MGVIDNCPAIRLELESTPQAPSIARGALSAVAAQFALAPELVDDLKTVVTEACNNVVMHAYGVSSGPLGILLYLDPAAVRVVVRDHGVGIGGEVASDGRDRGVGMQIIRALTSDSMFRRSDDGGTEVSMEVPAMRNGVRLITEPPVVAHDDNWISRLPGDTVISLSPVSLLKGVLGRVAATLAARARFSIDRFSDVYLAADAIATHATGAASGDRIGFGVAMRTRHLEITIGPFRTGASAILASRGPRRRALSALKLLADGVEVVAANGTEMLRVVIEDRWQTARASAAG